MRFRFVTSTPLDVRSGSGTYVGIHVLARALESLGHEVAFETPKRRLPIYTLQRLLFNRALRPAPEFDWTIGFDMDGYGIADARTHVASLKGVIADEVRFERGLTRWSMSLQSDRERLHVRRAQRVIVTSRYSAARAREFYGLDEEPLVVPELIDLAEWRRLLEANAAIASARFTVLFVGRFYRRKRIDVLLRAAAQLREAIPGLEVRIVGNGPCAAKLRSLSRDLALDDTVTWLGDVSRFDLVREYSRCDVFCLPSVQEGFGIVLLEAMAAGKPIVAARAGAIPEVAPHAILTDADSPHALAAGVESLYRSPNTRLALARTGAAWVEQFDAPRVAVQFVDAVRGAVPATAA
jgi:glycosyltransferase involved in cell wall biosynthesis